MHVLHARPSRCVTPDAVERRSLEVSEVTMSRPGALIVFGMATLMAGCLPAAAPRSTGRAPTASPGPASATVMPDASRASPSVGAEPLGGLLASAYDEELGTRLSLVSPSG